MENPNARADSAPKDFSELEKPASENSEEILLPIDIFSNGASCLESISEYLKEGLNLRYCKIADLLNRDDRTVWGAYKSAKEKSMINGNFADSSVKVQLSIFHDRSLSVLEALSEYLK